MTVIYKHGNSASATETISDVIRELQLISPDAPNFIAGDFNRCSLKTHFPKFSEYVSLPTRKNVTLDQMYGNILNAFKAYSLPAVGRSDHDLVHLVPAYRPRIKTEPVAK